MKKALLLIVLALTVSVTANAGISCETFYKLSDVVMGGRQDGISMPDFMGFCAGRDTESDRELCEFLVEAAYARPAYATKLYQDGETKEFAEKMYKLCREAKKK